MADLKLTVVLDGVSYVGSLQPVAVIPVAAPAPTPEPPPVVVPPPVVTVSSIPLSPTDTRFASNGSAGPTRVDGGALLNKTIIAKTPNWQSAAALLLRGGDLKNCAIVSDEAVRIGGGGDYLIEGCYLEAKAVNADAHADTIQIYAPGSSGKVTIKDTMIVAYNEKATAGMFVADEWSGDLVFENVAFKNGPFGLRVVEDAKDVTVSLKDVYFIGPFGWDEAFLFEHITGQIEIKRWENVREATIVDGKLVPGKLIPKP